MNIENRRLRFVSHGLTSCHSILSILMQCYECLFVSDMQIRVDTHKKKHVSTLIACQNLDCMSLLCHVPIDILEVPKQEEEEKTPPW